MADAEGGQAQAGRSSGASIRAEVHLIGQSLRGALHVDLSSFFRNLRREGLLL